MFVVILLVGNWTFGDSVLYSKLHPGVWHTYGRTCKLVFMSVCSNSVSVSVGAFMLNRVNHADMINMNSICSWSSEKKHFD